MSAFVWLFPAAGVVLGVSNLHFLWTLSLFAFIFSWMGLVGTLYVRRRRGVGVVLMIAAGVGGIVSTSYFYLVPGFLFIFPALFLLMKSDGNKR